MGKLIIKTSVLFTGEEVINKPMCVVINNDKIETIDDQKELGDIEAECIQTNFLMPGLIDMHVHITGYKKGSPYGNPFKPMKKFLKLALCNGVTTLRDVGNHLETIMYLKKWILKNDAPMIYSSGPLLDKPPVIWPSTRVITSEEEARTQVNNLFIEGVDLIKVYVNITPDLLKVIIEESHKKGLKVAGDICATGPIEAINFKIDTIEHIANLIDESFLNKNVNKNYLTEKKGIIKKLMIFSNVDLHSDKIKLLLDMLNKNNIYICPTLLVLKRNCFIEKIFEEPYLDYMIPIMPYHKYFKFMRNPMGRLFGQKHMIKHFPYMNLSPPKKAKAQNGFYKIIEFIKMLSENGINMIMGTDSPNPSIVPGFSLHEEMKLCQDAGIEPIKILKSATSLSAMALENKNIGVIKKDNIANLLLLNGNPITDISQISTIEYVILKGKLLKRNDLLREFEAEM